MKFPSRVPLDSESAHNLWSYKPSYLTTKSLMFLLFNGKFNFLVSQKTSTIYFSHSTHSTLEYSIVSNFKIESTSSHCIATLLQTSVLSPLDFFFYLFIKHIFHWNLIYQQKTCTDLEFIHFHLKQLIRPPFFHCEHPKVPLLSPSHQPLKINHYPSLSQ